MSEQEDGEYSVGFKKPPVHTQFKPGQSGNPKGRQKKTDTLADVLKKELNARITVVKDGKRHRIPMLRAIIKQNLNLAAKGDGKAFSNLLKALRVHQPEGRNDLGPLVEQFRAFHAQREASDRERRKVSEAGDRPSETEKHREVSSVAEDEQ
jgi:hypothetical protein